MSESSLSILSTLHGSVLTDACSTRVAGGPRVCLSSPWSAAAGSVTAVVVNWNSGAQLRECVESVGEHGDGLVSRISVVDNGSSDGSESAVEGLPLVTLIRAGTNLGFAKACNLGALQGDSRYLLFLNPDARLMEGALARVMAFVESPAGRDTGICGVRLVDEEGRVQRHCARFPTLRTYIGHCTGLSKVLPRVFPDHFMSDFDHLSNRFVDEVIGAFFLVRREVFEALNGFDERFFVYFEELDFALRSQRSGWKTFYLADAVAFHRGGGTTDQVKATRLFYSLRSRILYCFKNFSRPAAWGVAALTLLVEPCTRLLRATGRRSIQEIEDTVRGFSMLWKSVPGILKDRNRP